MRKDEIESSKRTDAYLGRHMWCVVVRMSGKYTVPPPSREMAMVAAVVVVYINIITKADNRLCAR